MTSTYLTTSQDWCHSLRSLMGYPAHAPAFHTAGWCFSAPRTIFDAWEVARLAADRGCDLVHVSIEPYADAPLAVSMAIRQDAGVEWVPGVRLYAASETARIELLTGDRRYFVGPRHFLTGAKLPPNARRANGEAIAWRRWRQAVSTMAPATLKGSVWVPKGGSFADAIPHEQIKIVA
ncbi:hypothetical protein [Sphingomonas montana]|uniref:hypothetical protein n=1 Tax=Sphingomonas montana TaxID=1843236 RepID=UPI00096E80E0|nr:hypothetical protein [Sphingomonas montana]